MNTVFLNGEYLPSSNARLSVDDRGFVFGDGIYEVVRVIEGRIFAWAEHASRMARGLGDEGIKAITFPDFRWARCDLKTVNLMGAVLAREAAHEAGAYEALMIRDGMLTEGAATNAFAVIDGVVRTYPLCNYILPSISP